MLWRQVRFFVKMSNFCQRIHIWCTYKFLQIRFCFRYRYIVMVSIYEKMFQGISSKCNALWDNARDDCTSYIFSNSSMIAVGVVYGIYYDWQVWLCDKTTYVFYDSFFFWGGEGCRSKTLKWRKQDFLVSLSKGRRSQSRNIPVKPKWNFSQAYSQYFWYKMKEAGFFFPLRTSETNDLELIRIFTYSLGHIIYLGSIYLHTAIWKNSKSQKVCT